MATTSGKPKRSSWYLLGLLALALLIWYAINFFGGRVGV
jgi:hypothetical protein